VSMKENINRWTLYENYNYALLLTRDYYTRVLGAAVLSVMLKGADLICTAQLCVSLLYDPHFSGLSQDLNWVRYSWFVIEVLGLLMWTFMGFRLTASMVAEDIEYVGDLVWSNNNCGPKPAGNRVASNLKVRAALILINMLQTPYLVQDVVKLCHPRKGSMKFSAFGGWGQIPRVFALGFENRVMLEYQLRAGMLASISKFLLFRVPALGLKIFLLIHGKPSWILISSVLSATLVTFCKSSDVWDYLHYAAWFRAWCVGRLQHGDDNERVIIEKLLMSRFFFTKGPSGELQEPGVVGVVKQIFGAAAQTSKNPDGFMAIWKTKVSAADAKIVINAPVEQEHSIQNEVIQKLELASTATASFRSHFWYKENMVDISYVDPTVDEPDGSKWKFASLITWSSFSVELAITLFEVLSTTMYTMGMWNFLVVSWARAGRRIAWTPESILLLLFILSRASWVIIAAHQALKVIAIDWTNVGDFVTSVGAYERLYLTMCTTILEMFVMPKVVKEAVSLFHPEKNVQPFCAFGGKIYGPRAYALGFATREMQIVANYRGIRTFTPVLLGDILYLLFLCWLIFGQICATMGWKRTKLNFGLHEFESKFQFSLAVVLVIAAALSILVRLRIVKKYVYAFRRYKEWIQERLKSSRISESEKTSLHKEWQTYFS